MKYFFFNNKYFNVIIYCAMACIATIISIVAEHNFALKYADYNNYVIFKQSFFHLSNNTNLYIEYVDEYFDLYKYSPTFAVWFAPLSYLPDWFGLLIWNVVNALLLLFAIEKMDFLNRKQKNLILFFASFELMTALHNSQSNALIIGLLCMAFAMAEKNKFWLVIICIVATFFIKIFGIVALLLLIFYPQKIKNTILTGLCVLIFVLMPLIIISFSALTNQYHNWYVLLQQDEKFSVGMSVYNQFYIVLKSEFNKLYILLPGVVLLLLPLLRCKQFKNEIFRVHYFCAIAIWIVIFNHRSESPTFIIAVTGAMLYLFSKKMMWLDYVLFASVMIFTCLSPTDIFPKLIRDEIVTPYNLKALPCILVWVKITFELLTLKFENNKSISSV
ncbi:MAG: hypothetical protein RJA07_703 [Bacteroidota bacterium]